MVYTGAEMESLKTDRSAMRRKVTTISNRLKKGIQTQLLNPAEIEATLKELKNTYLEFLPIDEEYAAAVEGDEGHKADYEIVNGLDLQQYSASVETIYQEAKDKYDKHSELIEQLQASEKLKSVVLEVKVKLRHIKDKITVIIPRVNTLLSDNGETVELQEDGDELEKITQLVNILQTTIEGAPEGDWKDVPNEAVDLLNAAEDKRREINLELRRRSELSSKFEF